MKTVERHKKTDFGDVWYVNAADGTYRFAVYKYDDDDETIYLSNVFVREDSRRQGYGNEILTSAEDYAKRLNASVICLKVLSGSDVHRWYKRHGYEDLEKDEEERGYMWMRKVLNVTESVWTDMQDRGTGDIQKKEDEIPEQFKKVLAIYIHTFAHLEAAAGNYTVGSCSEFIAFIKDYQNKPAIAREDPDIPELVQYVRDNWDFVCDIIIKTIAKVDDEVSVMVDNILDDMKKDVNESIWSDMQDRGTGDGVKTEDIDNMSFSELYQYMQKIYVCTKKYDIYNDNGRDTMTATLFNDKVKSYNIFFMKSMSNSRKIIYVEKDLVDTLGCFDEMEDKYYLEKNDVSDGVYICPDEYTEPTNRFFLEVFDYLLDKIHEPLEKHIEKKSNVNESIWSDMQDRGTGDIFKKEDDVNLFDIKKFRDYLKKAYDNLEDIPISCGYRYINVPVFVHKHVRRGLLWYPQKERAQLRSLNYEQWPEDLKKFLDENYTVEKSLDENRDWMYFIKPKDGEGNNKFFIKLLDDILNNSQNPLLKKKVNESIWSDMQDRGTGDLVKKEDDVNMMDVNKFFEYLIAKYWRPEQKVNSIDKDHYIKGFDTDIVVNPKHGMNIYGSYKDGELKQLMVVANERFLHICAKSPKNLVWTPSKPGESLNKRYYITEKNKEINNKTFLDVIEFLLHNDDVNESIWSQMQDRGVKDSEKKEDEMSQQDLECLDQYVMHFANEVVYGQGRGEEAGNLDEFCDYIRKDNEVKDANKEKILKYVKEVWFEELCDEVSGMIEQAEKEYHQDMYESVWSDMQDRGTGDIEKIEDDINRLDFEGFYDYLINRYDFKAKDFGVQKFDKDRLINVTVIADEEASRIYRTNIFDLDKDPYITVPDIKGFTKRPVFKKLSDNFNLEHLDDSFSPKFKVLPKDGGESNNKFFITVIDFIIDNAEYPCIPTIKRRVNESVWSDMQDRGTGEVGKKEDDVLSDDENRILKETSKMFWHAVRYVDDNDDYYYSDTKEDFIYYIEQRKGEMFWAGVKGPVYDKLIDYVKRNWKDDCKGIEEFTSEYIYECDGVPGGLTPADVGGMGAIYFPGPEGVPGSGDLPMPTGHVYKQIAPFDTFLKERKKKKNKKKKFRKEDEPCVHSPNAKVYDYVDDYRDYVDRTYNNVDKRK